MAVGQLVVEAARARSRSRSHLNEPVLSLLLWCPGFAFAPV